jgi:hypothetical protein
MAWFLSIRRVTAVVADFRRGVDGLDRGQREHPADVLGNDVVRREPAWPARSAGGVTTDLEMTALVELEEAGCPP